MPDPTPIEAVREVRTLLQQRTGALRLGQVLAAEGVVLAGLDAGDAQARGLCIQLFGQGSRHPRVIVQATHEFLDAGNLAQTRRFWPYLDRMRDPAGLVAAARCEYFADRADAARERAQRVIGHPSATLADLLAIFETMAEGGDAQAASAGAKARLAAPEAALMRIGAEGLPGPESVDLALRSAHSTPAVWLRALYRTSLETDTAPIAAAILGRHGNAALRVALAARHWFRGEFAPAAAMARSEKSAHLADADRDALRFLLSAAESHTRAAPQGWRAMPQVLHGDAHWMRARERSLTLQELFGLAQFLEGLRASMPKAPASWRTEEVAVLIPAALRSGSHDFLLELLQLGQSLPPGESGLPAGEAVDALLQAGHAAAFEPVLDRIASASRNDPRWLLRYLRILDATKQPVEDLQREFDLASAPAHDCAVRAFLASRWYERGSADRVVQLCDGDADHFAMDEEAAARMAHAQLALGMEVDAPGWIAAGGVRKATLLAEADCEPFGAGMRSLRATLDAWIAKPEPIRMAPGEKAACIGALREALEGAPGVVLADYARCGRALLRVARQLEASEVAGDLRSLVSGCLEALATHALRTAPYATTPARIEDYLVLEASLAHARSSAVGQAARSGGIRPPILLDGDRLDELARIAGCERTGAWQWRSLHGSVEVVGPFDRSGGAATLTVRGRLPPFFSCLEHLREAPFVVDEQEFAAALAKATGSGALPKPAAPQRSRSARREAQWESLLARAGNLGEERAPRVSVLMPIWNGDRFLADAVGSVVDQTFPSWKVLFVDDGSSDAGAHRMRALARERPDRFACLEHPRGVNRGLPASRNLGLANARGDYVAMLDIDDMWLPRKLETQVAILEGHPDCAMAYGPIMYWYGWTGRPDDMRRDFVSPHGTRHDTEIPAPQQLRHLILHRDGLPIPSGALVRRSVLESGHVRFDETFGMYEDEVFLAQLALRHPVYIHSEALERYRQHRDSFTALALRLGDYSPHRPNLARNRFLRWLRDHIANSGLDTAGELQALIDTQLAPPY